MISTVTSDLIKSWTVWSRSQAIAKLYVDGRMNGRTDRRTEHFQPKLFSAENFSAEKIFSRKTFWPKKFLVENSFEQKHFRLKTFRPENFSADFFATEKKNFRPIFVSPENTFDS